MVSRGHFSLHNAAPEERYMSPTRLNASSIFIGDMHIIIIFCWRDYGTVNTKIMQKGGNKCLEWRVNFPMITLALTRGVFKSLSDFIGRRLLDSALTGPSL